MKSYYLLLAATLLVTACSQSKKSSAETSDTVAIKKTEITTPSSKPQSFDMEQVPISEKVIGEFPYLKLPDDYTYNYEKEVNPKHIKDIDKEYIAIDGKLVPVEGKSFKVNLEKDRSTDSKRFNSLVVEKAIKAQIEEMGGIELKQVAVPNSEIERIGHAELLDKHYGNSLDFNLLDQIQTYVIRTKTKQIWIQMSLLNDESGKITVIEK